MKRLLKTLYYLKPYKKMLFGSVCLAVLFTIANVYFLPLTRNILKELSNKNLANFNNQILNAFVLYGIRLISQYGQYYLMHKLGFKLLLDIRMDIYNKLLHSKQLFYGKQKFGDLYTRTFSDSERIRIIITTLAQDVVPQVLTFLGVITYLFTLNWKLTLFSIITIPVFIWIISIAGERLKQTTHKIQQKSADLNHIFQEVITNIKIVQAYVTEDKEFDRLKQEHIKSNNAELIGIKIKAFYQPFIGYFQFFIIGLVLWYGGYEVVSGKLSGPELASFFTGIFLLIDPVIALSNIYTQTQESMASIDRVFDLLESDTAVPQAKNPIQAKNIQALVEIEHVHFKYPESQSPVLTDISLTALPGEVVALVGLSGAGKTTLINLIPRFYDPIEGTIRIDGTELKEYDTQSIRQHIGIVPQDDVIFRGTILENVQYGTFNASESDVMKALKQANAWEFVNELPDKLLCEVGDKGHKLSGGQKQRISLARAILRNPKILILDEATSALDSESEILVQEALENLMKNRTTFVIAHRLSTIQHADKIVVLEKGKIIEIGKHTELLEKNSAYAKFYNLQFKKKSE